MNIIYIHTHDSGRYLKPYGYDVPTPNLMEFAKESTLFRHCYCAGPTCSPSRAALLTGTPPHVNGMIGLAHRGFELNDYNMHLSRYLKTQGYTTVLCGVQHEAEDVTRLGYDRILTEGDRSADRGKRDVSNAHAVADYLKEQAKTAKNFFLSYGIFNTHRKFPEELGDIKQEYIAPPHCIYDTEQNRLDMAHYHASARIADHCVGVVLEGLQQSGLAEQTVVIFTTDHGIAFPHMKCNLYDTGIGVALMIKYPNNPTKGTATDSLVSHIDIFPTLCDLCGIQKPDWLSGKSLQSILNGGPPVNSEIFAEVTYHAAYEPMRCIRTDRYKLIRRYDYHNSVVPANIDKSKSKKFLLNAGLLERSVQKEMLFDLHLDPIERENLINDSAYKDVYEDLSARLADYMEKTNDPLIGVTYRVPAPKGAKVNKLICLNPIDGDFE